MAFEFGSRSFYCAATVPPSPLHSQLSSLRRPYFNCQIGSERHGRSTVVKSCHFHRSVPKGEGYKRSLNVRFATCEESSYRSSTENVVTFGRSYIHFEGTDGKPGFLSFYNRPYRKERKVIPSLERSRSSFLWFLGPAILVVSFIFPSLYLRRVISSIFEDSLLTDFLILFFTEALFYCGVAVFLLLIDCLWRPLASDSSAETSDGTNLPLGERIYSVVTMALGIIVPAVTMGLIWPWTGPAASATLAPYLVGIVTQFAFEQFAKRKNSPSWPVIPIVFQVYRLHQLNRAVQLVTALSFTVRGAELTTHNLAVSSSLGTLSNVLQVLGVICIWSLSSFIMRLFPFTAIIGTT